MMDAGKVFDELLEGGISRSHQVDARGVHLTVAEVTPIHGRGDVDFAGSEMKPARGNPAEPIERMPGEPHGWWRLDAGSYLVRFNERLKDGAPAMILIASERLLACGCSLAAACVGPGELRTVMNVPQVGLRMKQNARIGLLLG